MSTSGKTWFITGASRGFGRIWAEGALARGDKVVATARAVGSLSGLVEKYGDAVLCNAHRQMRRPMLSVRFSFNVSAQPVLVETHGGGTVMGIAVDKLSGRPFASMPTSITLHSARVILSGATALRLFC
jgi:NAD(P)-dependent dehydrogenase (short-subunit alcohol dehydrogenase family)